jgi:hypothetical protein
MIRDEKETKAWIVFQPLDLTILLGIVGGKRKVLQHSKEVV